MLEPNEVRIVYCPDCKETHYTPLSVAHYKFCQICGKENNVAVLSVLKGKLKITYDDKVTTYLSTTKTK